MWGYRALTAFPFAKTKSYLQDLLFRAVYKNDLHEQNMQRIPNIHFNKVTASKAAAPNMSTVDNSIIKYKNWQHFFNKKFSGKVQHAPWYFRQLSRAAANNGCAALLKGGAYVIAFRSLDEWQQIYDISLRRSATLRTSLPPPPPPTLSDPQPRHYNARPGVGTLASA